MSSAISILLFFTLVPYVLSNRYNMHSALWHYLIMLGAARTIIVNADYNRDRYEESKGKKKEKTNEGQKERKNRKLAGA
ncbi:hypothetical protein [Amphritea sp. HPY]|uniref:hypothetical protein n=1 Tax=Amphritea sp. HPY TaxID=3421652 RepID=UPI003D7C8DDD